MHIAPSTALCSRLAGRRAVLTAAGSGLGRAAALQMAREGASVLVSDLDPTKAAAVVDEIRFHGGAAWSTTCDAGKADDCMELVRQAEECFGAPIDLFLANAGASIAGSFLEATEQQVRGVVQLNLLGNVFSAQAALSSMVRGGGGSLLFTSSLQSVTARHHRALYTATKHAITGLVKALALEFGPKGVRVNAVAPAITDTPFLRELLASTGVGDIDAALSRSAERLPLGRLPTPQDFSEAVCFLASTAARSVTGHVLLVDAGASAGIFTPPSTASH